VVEEELRGAERGREQFRAGDDEGGDAEAAAVERAGVSDSGVRVCWWGDKAPRCSPPP